MESVKPKQLEISVEETPNPNSKKFVLNQTLFTGGGIDFSSKEAALNSPLAQELFRISDVAGVFVGSNFVTVSMKPGANWWALQPILSQTIETFMATGQAPVGAGAPAEMPHKAMTDIEAGILRILEDEIRPAVAMDGGDITFHSYENGVLKVQLRGSCHSCPSSTVTLKAGIENRLKQEFPEIVSVEAV